MASPQALFDAAGCFLCLDSWHRKVIGTRRLADWLLTVSPDADVTANALMARSGCLHCLTAGDLQVIRLRVLADLIAIQDPEVDVTPAGLSAELGCWICRESSLVSAAAILAIPVQEEETPTATLARASCYACLGPWTVEVMEVRMLMDILAVYDPDADVTPQGLLSRSACFACLSPLAQVAMIGVLLNQATLFVPSDTPFDTFDGYPLGGVGFTGFWTDGDVVTFAGDDFSEYAVGPAPAIDGGTGWDAAATLTDSPSFATQEADDASDLGTWTTGNRDVRFGYEGQEQQFDGSTLTGVTTGP